MSIEHIFKLHDEIKELKAHNAKLKSSLEELFKRVFKNHGISEATANRAWIQYLKTLK